jgi:uncharacterized protein (TIGR02147 family)
MSTRVFDFLNYKDFINEWVLSRPKKGRGEFLRMAKAMKIQSSQVSQIFKGDRDLNLEQGNYLADYIAMGNDERRYFLDLINLSRAGTPSLRDYLKSSLKDQKKEADRLARRLKFKRELSDVEKAIYYSDSLYSIVHLLTFIPKLNSVEKIASRVRVPKSRVQEVVEFLLDAKLLRKGSIGLEPGENTIHIDNYSPLVLNHHRNWRSKAIERQARFDPSDLFYSGQMTMAKKDYDRCKEILRKTLEEIYKIVEPSESEDLYNLNFDFYQIGD